MATLPLEPLAAIVDRLVALAQDDERLRADLRSLAQYVLEATEPASAALEPLSASAGELTAPGAAATPAEPIETAPLPALAVEAPAPLPPLTLGQPRPQEPISVPPVISWRTPSDAEFPVLEARCKLKAEGCRWAARRRQLLADRADYGTEIEPIDRDLISRAKALPDCFLWMCHKDGPQPADARAFEVAAACFENLADALSAVKQVLDEPGLHESEFEPALDLLAEAQSALRAAVADLDYSDADQHRVYHWLRETAAENRLYIQRYMRLDDTADPRQWPGLAARIDELDQRVQDAQRQSKQRRKLLGKVRHKAALIAARPAGGEDEWKILIDTVEELVSGGLPPSNRELRDALLPAIEELPDLKPPKGFAAVLREIDRYLALSPAPAAALPAAEQPPEVQEAARLLQGKSLVLIGGERRPAAAEAIEQAFGLQALYWIQTRDHQSIAGFEPYIARPDVALVLLAIRWSSHAFGDARQFCDRHGKPLVRLPTGYNPGQIATQILRQCSDRLSRHD